MNQNDNAKQAERQGEKQSVWRSDFKVPHYPPLPGALKTTDVVIVGAGIVGLTTAYLLAKEGRKVLVLDDGEIASGESGNTTAHLASAVDDYYTEISSLHGKETAKLVADSHQKAIATIEKIVRNEKIDCEFLRVPGYLFAPEGESDQLLQDEYDCATECGLKVDWVETAPFGFNTGRCLKFDDQAQFHPLKYLSALATKIVELGGEIYTNTHVSEFDESDHLSIMTSDGGRVHANHIVVATNTPVNDRLLMHTKQAAYRTYVIGAKIPAGSLPRGLLWDTLDPYHYVRTASTADPQMEVLIVGGEDHKTGQSAHPEDSFGKLEAWLRERFTAAGEILFRWSGQIMEPVDYLAFIGRNPLTSKEIYIATGDSGNGMTHGTIAGILLTDLIMGRSNEWEEVYDPSRKKIKAIGTYTKENLNAAYQYKDWLHASESIDEEAIPENCGRVLNEGGHKIAVFKDENGRVTKCSAVCPHLGGIVKWNDEAKSWDCPVHGSRFSPDGTVLNGPSLGDLATVAEEGEENIELRVDGSSEAEPSTAQ